MTNKENKPIMEGNRNIGPFSCCASIKRPKEGYIDAICDMCDKVFKTDNDVYVCPECKKKAENIRQ